ncbi:hypothetical protein [Mangrovicoccus sp. HB161399]|uniref:hypothetical protein n=1 Tax=Mangrovicoccus sp. HB161399 TaxID=2720392 RepID=UPI0015535784|nr:hypothetical protein [Mangrovicoccus sp. HB161399]
MKKTDPLFPNSAPTRAGTAEKLAASFGLLWLCLGAAAFRYAPGTIGPGGLIAPLVLFGLLWHQSRALRLTRQEAAALRDALGAMTAEHRAAAVPPRRDTPAPARQEPSDGDRPATTVFGVRSASAAERMQETGGPAPSFASRRDPLQPGAAPGSQGSLALDTAPTPPPLTVGDFILALNFPQDPDDTDGFRALRLALKAPQAAPLIQAAQDVLTLLSQNGLYMDDLEPDHPKPELWRRFAAGERGGAIGALGGVRDAEALANCAAALREDPVFRDAVHHFLRHFDLMLVARAGALEDAALVRLAETRTARAFMLLGRCVGMFD